MPEARRFLTVILATAFTVSLQAAEPPRLPAKAERLIVRKGVLYNANLDQSVDFLVRESRKVDPDQTGLDITLDGHKDEATLIRMRLTGLPIGEVLRTLAKKADLDISVDGEAIHLKTKLKEPRLRGSAVSIQADDSPKLPPKAERLIVPQLVFQDAKLNEVVDFLVRKSRELDPAHTGLKMTLGGHKDELTEINISLMNVPMADVIRMFALQADLEIGVQGETINLKTKLKEPRLYPKEPPAPTIPGLEPVPPIPK
jgi:hypothetical protein